LIHATDLLEYLDATTYNINCKKVRAQRTHDYVGRGEDNDDIDWEMMITPKQNRLLKER